MVTTEQAQAGADVIDHIVGLRPGMALYATRHARDKVAVATQKSYELFFGPQLGGLALRDRLAVAYCACVLSKAAALGAHYRQALAAQQGGAALADALQAGSIDTIEPARLRAMLAFTKKLIEKPVEGDAAALKALQAAGISTPDIVALAQLVAFLSYQLRSVAGLQAMQAEEQGAANSAEAAAVPRQADIAPVAPQRDGTPTGKPVKSHGFTNESLEWKAWLDVLDLDRATPEQLAVLEMSHPKAKQSDYYRFLAHQPEVLKQRSEAYNAIMYAPGGLARADRELGALTVSRINGCVYCASVHAQRFEQLAKRNDTVQQVFDDPRSAGTTDRERAVAHFAVQMTEDPSGLGPQAIQALKTVGMNDAEVLDLIHAVAIFGWANRLMLNLGEPVFPAA
ncbi:CMD domain-containing protein [Candidimonas nitroreducens]|uniref:Carboxymuconolactone decarboxylase n=1 Tax=Candidimonas nitroreducens TaxID=683354 RepID=A0A225MUG9_9BURK|nr:peroxidase-related enzyme [Candidimonas nitroreducens]OWT64113.1 carboxymuconolactone decarboxylase [Candidimonas nitroreducens]